MDHDPNNGRELVPLAPRALEYIVQPEEPLFPYKLIGGSKLRHSDRCPRSESVAQSVMLTLVMMQVQRLQPPKAIDARAQTEAQCDAYARNGVSDARAQSL